MEAATALLEFTECGTDSVAHVHLVQPTTNLPKYVPLYVPMVLSGPTLIENAFALPTISMWQEFASNAPEDNCLTQPSKDVNQSAILVMFMILELTNADPNVVHSKSTLTILDTVFAPQDTN